MQAMVCEICKSNSFSKLDEFLQCDFCRTKYSVEQAQKLLVEGVVTVDRSAEALNILALAERSLAAGNSEGALQDVKRVLEIDQNIAAAWQLSARANLMANRAAADLTAGLHDLQRAASLGTPEERATWNSEALTLIAGLSVPAVFERKRVRVEPCVPVNYFLYGIAVLDLISYSYSLTGDLDLLRNAEKVAQINMQYVEVRKRKAVDPTVYVTQELMDSFIQRFEWIGSEIRRYEPKHKSPRLKSKAPIGPLLGL